MGEAALDDGQLPASQLETLRSDLEACLPELRACRQLLVAIPVSREEHPRVVDVLRYEESLCRLRRVHNVVGDALRVARLSREVDFIDVEDR